MTNAEKIYIRSMEEPNEVLITGNQKRIKPLFAQKWDSIQQLRDDLGEEEFLRREEEWKEWEAQRRENQDY